MSEGYYIYTWETFKQFASAYSLPIYYIEYDNKYDVAVYLGGVRHNYIMGKDNADEVAELLAIPQGP